MSILVIDLGTTYFKFAVFDHGGRMQALSRHAVPITGQRGGRAELAVDAFEHLIKAGIADLQDRCPRGLASIEAMTFASQTNSFVLLDAHDRPLTPLVLWPDARAIDQEENLRGRLAGVTDPAITGVPLLNHQFMAAKLLWTQHNEPDIWHRTARVLLISDYLTLLFTGRHVSEAGAAGLTGLVDVHSCDWIGKAVAAIGLRPEWLPQVVRAGTDLGAISREAARRYRLPESCRFVVGCLDQYAGAIGAGNLEAGGVSETTGTVLATVRCADRLSSNAPADVFQGPAWAPNRYFQMVFGGVSANYLEAFRNQQAAGSSFEELIAFARDIPPGADGLRLKAGIDPAQSADLFVGLAPSHSRGHQVRCILEAVASALRAQVSTLCGTHQPDEIRAVGGAARSELWLAIKADVLGIRTRAVNCPEPTSLGVAVLAEARLRAVEPPAVAAEWIETAPAHEPNAAVHARYAELGL